MTKTISKKTVESVNTRCKNGFRFDVQRFTERGEKQLCRFITLRENEKLVKLTLWWRDETICYQNSYGCTVRKYTGNVVPELHCAVWHTSETSHCWTSHGIGEFHPFSEHPSPKRLLNGLADATALVTDELILSLMPEWEREECRQALATKTE